MAVFAVRDEISTAPIGQSWEERPIGENRPGFRGDEWYRKMMDKRTRAALRQQNEEFERNHAGDSDEELLAMVRARAQILGHAPQMCEVVGAHMVARRFGNWTKVLHRLGYKSASGTQILERSQRYKFEYARQQAIYRTERREKNEKRIARRRMKTAKVSEPEDEKPTENREKNRATE